MKIKYIPIKQVNLPEAFFDGVSVIVPKEKDESETLYLERKSDWIKFFRTKTR